MRIELETKAFTRASFSVAGPRDVLVSSAVPIAAIVDDVMIGARAQHVIEGLDVGSLVELDAEAKTDVTITPLPNPPTPTRITRGKPIELRPQLVAPGDPRGPFVDIAVELDTTQVVHIETAPVAKRSAGALRLLELGLHACADPRTTVVFANDSDPETKDHEWKLDAGTCVLRLRPRASAPECTFEHHAPSWCARGLDSTPQPVRVLWTRPTNDHESSVADPPEARRAAEHVIADASVSLQLQPAPERTRRSVELERGNDIVVSWTPASAGVSYEYRTVLGETWGFMHDRPTVFARAEFERIDIAVGNTAARERVEIVVDALAPPPKSAEVSVGGSVVVRTRAVAPEDPRGPVAEIVAKIETRGEYVVSTTFAGGPAPRIEMMASVPGRVARSDWSVLGPPTLVAERFVVDEPGEVVIRVDGVGPRPERALTIALEAVETPAPR